MNSTAWLGSRTPPPAEQSKSAGGAGSFTSDNGVTERCTLLGFILSDGQKDMHNEILLLGS